MESDRDRTLNFLGNWVDANIVKASEEPDKNPKTLEQRFLTDAVADGFTLDMVNDAWSSVEREITNALSVRVSVRSSRPRTS